MVEKLGSVRRPVSGLMLGIGLLLATPAALVAAAVHAAEPGLPPAPVEVAAIGKQPVTPQAAFTGRIEAIDRVDLRARIEGYLEARRFTEGQTVKPGDLLFSIEKASYVAAVQEAEGALATAQATLTRAQLELNRNQELAQRQVASQAKLDTAVADVAQSKGEVLRAQATLDRARLNLGYTDVTAPIGGKIGKAAFSVGSFVSPGSGALATIVSQDPIDVAFPISQRDLLAVRREAKVGGGNATDVVVKLKLADGSTYDQVGHVNFIDVQTDPNTDSVTIRARVANTGGYLVDRQLVTVVVEASKPEEALVVPQRAVMLDQGGRYVFVVDAQNRAQQRRVVVGDQVGTLFVVREGLSESDKVVVEGIQKVRPGAPVTPLPVAPLPAAPNGPAAAAKKG